MQNFSKEMSVNRIYNFFKSQGMAIGKNTLYEYIDRIQDSSVIFFLARYSNKVYIRESWPKKVYVCDTGLTKVARFSRDTGKLMENAVFLELLRLKNKRPLIDIYYYKSKDGKEVDFVLRQGDRILMLLQVCLDLSDPEVKKRETKALLKAAKELGCDNLLVINWDYEGEESFERKKIRYIPLYKWLIGDVL